jgi:flagellar biosynthesis/type III secretory pathway chaperone
VNGMAFQALLRTIADLNDSHHTLLELADLKKDVLIHDQVAKLTEIVTKENKLIKQIGIQNQERLEAVGNFLIEKGYKPNPKVTISDLTKIIFNIEDKKALMDSQRQLKETIHQLRQKNAVNQQLIEQSLIFIDYSLDLYIGPPDDEAVYHNPGQQLKGNKRPGVFDTRA